MPVFQLSEDLVFPPTFLAEPDGLLAVGGDLRVERLLLAYRTGIFPWYNEGEPILWWSPNPRLILLPEEFRISRRLRRVIKSGKFRVTFDTAFRGVLAGCADARGPGREGTWITRDMLRAYGRLHDAGYAHSVESWHGEELVGGLYGVSLGGCFFGESMFSTAANASKVALAALVARLEAQGFSLIDCQVHTRHLVSMGAREVSRKVFLRMLEEGLRVETPVGSWAAPGYTA